MAIRLEVIEFFDPTNRSLVQRIPPSGSADINHGAQLIVQQNQVAIFFRDGQALDQFGPGRHTLQTGNIPLLSRLLSIPWEKNPFRALIYFVGTQTFVDQKWGTRQPLLVRDDELGTVRLRAFGRYSMRVADPAVLINTLVGTQQKYTTDEISHYLRDVIVARLSDLIGSAKIALYDLPSRFDELASAVRAKVAEEFRKYGLELVDFFINAITPPPEVQAAIDARTGTRPARDLQDFTMHHTSQSMRKLTEREGEGTGDTPVDRVLPLYVQQALRQAKPGNAAAEATRSPTPMQDPRVLVRNVATSSEWAIETGDRAWTITVPLSALRRQRVMVRFDRRDSAGHEVIQFLSYAGPASEELSMSVLRRNSTLVHGAFAIETTSGGELFVVQASQLAETADVLEISRAITSIAWHADQLEQELFEVDNL